MDTKIRELFKNEQCITVMFDSYDYSITEHGTYVFQRSVRPPVQCFV